MTTNAVGVRVLFPGPLTSADCFTLPETNLRIELLDGKVVLPSLSTVEHQRLLQAVFTSLGRVAQSAGGEAFVAPLDVELSADVVLQPDVFYIAPASAATVAGHVLGPPDIVVEVLWPGTRRYDLDDKRPRYAESGVREFWTIDPLLATITVAFNVDGVFRDDRSVPFGQPIPSAIATIGEAGLGDFGR